MGGFRSISLWDAEMEHKRVNRIDPEALFELAVFAAPAIEPDIHRTAIKLRLTRNAGPNARQHLAARFRDFVTAFQAMGRPLAQLRPLDKRRTAATTISSFSGT